MKYLSENTVLRRFDVVHTDGYGKRKHYTGIRALVGKKWYRVYSCCFSNCATIYIEIRKEWHVVNEFSEVQEKGV